MRRRSVPIALLATLATALASTPALGFDAGVTFLTGGLDLPAGAIAGGASGAAESGAERSAVSGDGRYVAFVSEADTLDPAAHPDVANVYRKDRLTGEVVLVSRADGPSGAAFPFTSWLPAISDDGRRIAFKTRAPLVAADADGTPDVYVRDIGAGTTTLASVDTTSGVGGLDLSGDGTFVVFATEDQVDPAADRNASWDVYRRNLVAGTTVLVSDDAAGGVRAGNGSSIDPSVSDDGVWVAFASQASDLVAGYVSGTGYQVFVRDMTARRTELVSNARGSFTTGSNGGSGQADVAGAPASGTRAAVFVAYTSAATNIHSADSSGQDSVFRRQLSTSASLLVSRATGAAGANADNHSNQPAISDDGSLVAFTSLATNLGGEPPAGVYLRRISDNATLRVAPDVVSAQRPALAGDGSYLAWYQPRGVTADSDPDLSAVFGRTFSAPSTPGDVELVSRPAGAAPFLSTWIAVDQTAASHRTVSADGRYVVFKALTSRLPGGSVGGLGQIYRRDTLTGAIELVSRATGVAGTAGEGDHGQPTISADGSRVAFRSDAPLAADHDDGSVQVYVRDLAVATTTLVSRADGVAGAIADQDTLDPAISADGTHVAFATSATNLGVAGGDQHVYVRDLADADTELIDRASGGGAPGNDDAELPSLSADGRLVAFGSQADNLDPDDGDRVSDAYVRDMASGVTTLVSRRNGLTEQKAVGPTWYPALSADGTTVVFQAGDETIAPEAGPWGGVRQIVARTLATGANALVSRAPGGTPANADADQPTIDATGAVVAFRSQATNLLPGVGGSFRAGVFARTLATGALSGPPAFGLVDAFPDDGATGPSISGDGRCLAFAARGHNAFTGLAGDGFTTYMHVVSGACPTLPPVVRPAPRRTARRAPRPTLTRASLLHKRFRVGRAATARTAWGAPRARGAERAHGAARRGRGRRVRRAPVGTAFRFTLNTQARVTILLEREAQGRLVGRFCRKPRPRLRRNLRCVRFVQVTSLSRRGVPAGTRRIAFSGRVGRRALAPRGYRARLRATNAAGRSAWVRLRFRIVRR